MCRQKESRRRRRVGWQVAVEVVLEVHIEFEPVGRTVVVEEVVRECFVALADSSFWCIRLEWGWVGSGSSLGRFGWGSRVMF